MREMPVSRFHFNTAVSIPFQQTSVSSNTKRRKVIQYQLPFFHTITVNTQNTGTFACNRKCLITDLDIHCR